MHTTRGDYYRAFVKLEIKLRTLGPQLAAPYPRKGSTLKLLQQGSRSWAQRTGSCQDEQSPRQKAQAVPQVVLTVGRAYHSNSRQQADTAARPGRQGNTSTHRAPSVRFSSMAPLFSSLTSRTPDCKRTGKAGNAREDMSRNAAPLIMTTVKHRRFSP